jgi:uncharacterized protein
VRWEVEPAPTACPASRFRIIQCAGRGGTIIDEKSERRSATDAIGQTHPLRRRQAKVVEAKAPVCYTNFMKRDEAISRLQQHEADLKRLDVEHLYMFGSTARGEA